MFLFFFMFVFGLNMRTDTNALIGDFSGNKDCRNYHFPQSALYNLLGVLIGEGW